MSQVTTIDLGSNSFRVLVYDYKKHTIINEYHEIVGTADGLIDTNHISNSAVERIQNAIHKSSEQLKYNPKECIAVTTAAMRIAKNSDSVIRDIINNTGLKLNIIDAEEEAKLTLLAIKYALKRENILSDNFILLDIGGGSVELIIHNNKSFYTKSFDFGIVTLEQLHKNNKDLLIDLENRKKSIKSYLGLLDIDLNNYKFIATAGTPTTIASIKKGQNSLTYNKDEVNGSVVNLFDLDNCIDLLNNSNDTKKQELFGTNKKEFIEVGIFIYKAFFDVLNKSESIVFDDGLREGVAINYAIAKT